MQDGKKALIDAALEHPSPWPFAATLEAMYQSSSAPSVRRHLRVTLLVAASSIIAALALEAPRSRADLLYLLAWRVGGSLVLVAAAFTARWTRSVWQEAGLVTIAASSGMGVVEILGEHAAPQAAEAYMFASIALVAGILTSSRVRFSTAIATCLGCAILFPLLMLGFPGSLPLRASGAMCGAMLIGFSIILLAARRNDINRRSEYLHRLRHEMVEIELTELNNELLRLSTTDMLTGLYNRRKFKHEASRIWNDRDQPPFVVAMIDVDYFKNFNDSAGHAAGDACLVAVAHALEGALRSDRDRAARYGGEEFVVLIPNAGSGSAQLLGERLRLAVEALHVPHPGLPGQHVTVSVGAISQDGRDGSFDALLGAADRLLYQAKTAGRNRVCSGVMVQPSALPAS